MQRFFVTAKQIMLATVLFAGLSFTACDDDDDEPEPEKPGTEQGGDNNQGGEEQKPGGEEQKPGGEEQKPGSEDDGNQGGDNNQDGDNTDSKPELPDFFTNFELGPNVVYEAVEGGVKITAAAKYDGSIVYKFPEAVAAGKTIKIELDSYMVADDSKIKECQVVFQGADGTLKETNNEGNTVDVCRYNWDADAYNDTQWTVGEGQTCTQIVINRQEGETYFIVKSITVE